MFHVIIKGEKKKELVPHLFIYLLPLFETCVLCFTNTVIEPPPLLIKVIYI